MKGLDYLNYSFLGILGFLRERFGHYSDYGCGANVSYSIGDIVLGGFSLFLLQNSSFLEQQRLLEKRKGSSNYRNLFGLGSVPTDVTIRSNLDEIKPSEVFKSYDYVYTELKKNNLLCDYKMDFLGYLLNFDGMQLIESKKITCDCCNSRELKNGETQYYHSCVQPVISHPSCKEIIPLPCEFIESQADSSKQDSEINASKRWLTQYLAKFKDFLGETITIVGDDLYAHEPFCKLLIGDNVNFVFVCKPESHTHLYSEIALLKANEMMQNHQLSQLQEKETLSYHYQFITHNFGHGQKYLANTLYALNIIAFLFHNFLKISSLLYNKII